MALPVLETPTYELILPSTGRKVTYRPFLVREHKILLTLSEAEDSEVARMVREVVDVCTFKKLDIKNLPHFDVEYIFMQLRSKSIGEKVDVVMTCKECGEKIETSFNIDDLKVEKADSHTNRIMLNNDFGVEMSYPDFDDVIAMFNNNDKEKIYSIITKSIKSIFNESSYWETKDQTAEEIEDFVNSLTKAQFDLLENFFVTAPKIVQVVEADCPKCSTHNISRLEGLQNFFV